MVDAESYAADEQLGGGPAGYGRVLSTQSYLLKKQETSKPEAWWDW